MANTVDRDYELYLAHKIVSPNGYVLEQPLKKDTFEKIDRAYNNLTDAIPKRLEGIELAEETLTAFHEEIDKWDGESDIEFIMDFLIGRGVTAITAVGPGAAVIRNFEIFMKDCTTREKIKKLFTIKKNYMDDRNICALINQNCLIKHLESYTFVEGNKPWILTRRFMLMIFIDIFTSIASIERLRQVRIQLEPESGDIPRISEDFCTLQIEIRKQIDEYLIFKGVYESTSSFVKALIAWELLYI